MVNETEDDNDRRKKFLLLLLSGALITGLAVFATGSVMAASLSISDGSLTTDNGAVTGITVDVSGDITWDGAENAPGSTDIKLEVKNPGGSWATIDSKTADLSGLAGTHSYSFTGADVTNSDWNNGDFNAAGDGDTKDTDLTFRLTVETTGDIDGDSNADTIQSDTNTATVSVTNEANSNDAGGSGGVNPQGTNNSP